MGDKTAKSNYRKLALKYHPDTNTAPDAKQDLQKLNAAYHDGKIDGKKPIQKSATGMADPASHMRKPTRTKEQRRPRPPMKRKTLKSNPSLNHGAKDRLAIINAFKNIREKINEAGSVYLGELDPKQIAQADLQIFDDIVGTDVGREAIKGMASKWHIEAFEKRSGPMLLKKAIFKGIGMPAVENLESLSSFVNNVLDLLGNVPIQKNYFHENI